MFSISQGFKLKLSKEGDDGLAVKDIVIDAGREECGSFLLFDVGCHIAQSERSGMKTKNFIDASMSKIYFYHFSTLQYRIFTYNIQYLAKNCIVL